MQLSCAAWWQAGEDDHDNHQLASMDYVQDVSVGKTGNWGTVYHEDQESHKVATCYTGLFESCWVSTIASFRVQMFAAWATVFLRLPFGREHTQPAC